MPFQSTKTWGHERGLSCAFRQWRAESHCNKLHGYSLAIKLVFETDELDDRNWVVDFGAFKSLKESFDFMYDHKTIVANDDPKYELFVDMANEGMLDLRTVPNVGCEAFAQEVFYATRKWMVMNDLTPRVRLVSAEVAEHPSNSAIYTG